MQVEGLCRRDATLRTVGRTHSFVLDNLSSPDSTLSACLPYIQGRFKERRSKTLIHLLEYLHDVYVCSKPKLTPLVNAQKKKTGIPSCSNFVAWNEVT